LALATSLVPLAAPGPASVPGADAGAPGWLLGVYGDGLRVEPLQYRTWLWIAFAAYLAVVVFAPALGTRTIELAAVAAAVTFVLAPPLLSLDVFSYLSYARLGVLHGLNPYDVAPSAISHDAAAMRVQDFRDATTVYGPLFTLGSYPLALIGVPAGLWALKAICGAALIGIGRLTRRLASIRCASAPRALALVGLNPLILVHVAGGPHNDALMVLGVMAASLALVEGRAAGGAGALVAAYAVKSAAAFAAPFALIGARPQRRSFLVAAIVAVVLVVLAGLALFGSSVSGGLLAGPGSQSHTSYHSVPALLNRAIGLDLAVAKALLLGLFALLVAWLLAWTARGGDWIKAAGWCALGLLAASAYVTPWYVLWLLPFAAIGRDRRLVVLTLILCAYQIPAAL
jgi:glycosyl transferase family 87